MLQQFSVSGVERDQTLRLQLVVTCLDLLLDLKPYVVLDEFESVPVCILLRTFGINVIQKSMMMHWNLRSRSIALLCKSLRLLRNISQSEQGTRMLAYTRTHVVLLELLAQERIRDRETRYLLLQILCNIAVFQSFRFFHVCEERHIRTILLVAKQTSANDFEFIVELCSFLCMLSVDPGISRLLVSCEALGYVVQFLHISTIHNDLKTQKGRTADANTTTDEPERSSINEPKELVSMNIADQPAQPLHYSTEENDSAAFKNADRRSSNANLLESSSDNLDGNFSSTNTIDSINSTMKNAYSAGSQIVSNFIGGPQSLSPSFRQSFGASGSNLNDSTESNATASDDSDKVISWVSALIHNLCLSMRDDITMRMVISQAYEASFSWSSSTDHPIFCKIMAAVHAICSDEEENQPNVCEDVRKDRKDDSFGKDDNKIVNEIVERMLEDNFDQSEFDLIYESRVDSVVNVTVGVKPIVVE